MGGGLNGHCECDEAKTEKQWKEHVRSANYWQQGIPTQGGTITDYKQLQQVKEAVLSGYQPQCHWSLSSLARVVESQIQKQELLMQKATEADQNKQNLEKKA